MDKKLVLSSRLLRICLILTALLGASVIFYWGWSWTTVLVLALAIGCPAIMIWGAIQIAKH